MKNLFCCEIVGGKGAIALLSLRFVSGAAFILHGWPKIQNATAWAGDGLPPVIQALVAFGEFAGGIAILAGFMTRFAAAGLVIIMAGAVQMHVSKGDPFVGQAGSWELAAVYLSIMIALALRGPGAASLDAVLFRPKP